VVLARKAWYGISWFRATHSSITLLRADGVPYSDERSDRRRRASIGSERRADDDATAPARAAAHNPLCHAVMFAAYPSGLVAFCR
jgi:hypothetical protein